MHEKQVMLENDTERFSQEFTRASKTEPTKKVSKSRSQKSSKGNKMSVVEDDSSFAPSITSALSEFFHNVASCDKKFTCETPYTVETDSIEVQEKPVLVETAPSASALPEFFHDVAVSDKKITCETPYTAETESIEVHEKPVLVGDNCTVRVLQMRTFGLVVQLANGDKGMLRFKVISNRQALEIYAWSLLYANAIALTF